MTAWCVATFVSVLALLSTGCETGATRESPPVAASTGTSLIEEPPAVPPVVLPNLSKISVSAQSQLREAHSALLRKQEGSAATDRDLAIAYGELGKLLLAGAYRDAAEACFLNAEAVDPADFQWPYYLGHVYNASGDAAKAAAAFERAARGQPGDVPSLVWLGRAELDRGRPADAQRNFEKVLALQPGTPSALLGLGQVALARQDHAGAIRYLEEALAIDSKAGAIRYPLAMAYRETGNVARAEANLRQRSMRQVHLPDPLMEQVEALLQTAVAYEIRGGQALDKGEWAAAADYFRKGIERAPNEPSLRHKLGTALAMSGDTSGAIRQFQNLTQRWPAFAKGQYSLGIILASGGRYREAIEYFTAALKSDATDVQVRLQLAAALRAVGRFDAALDQYARAAELDPRLAEAYFGRALALVRLKRYREARDRLVEAMKVFPDQPRFAHGTARLLAVAPDSQVRDGRRSLEILEGLLRQGPPSIALAETMAMALAETGQYGGATTWQRQAIAAARKTGLLDQLQRMADNLTLYEQGKPCRQPCGDENAFEAL